MTAPLLPKRPILSMRPFPLPPAVKKALKILAGIFLLFVFCGLVDQLWCLRRLDGSDFVTRAWETERSNSATDMSYIGVSGNRAYLQYWSFGRWQDIVYWTPLSELPDDLVARLKAGDPPWDKAREFMR